MSWDFAVLGTLRVRYQGELVPITSNRQRALLATLVLRCNDTVSVGDLVDRIWSEKAPAHGAAGLQSLVMRLRRALSVNGPDPIDTRTHGYQLTVPPDAVDLARFEALRTQARHAKGEERSDLLQKAISLGSEMNRKVIEDVAKV